MNMRKKKIVSLLVIGMWLMMFILPVSISTNTAQAATKASLSESELTIGLGAYGSPMFIFNKTDDKYAITVNNPVKGAKYSFKSSSAKIVTVKAGKTKGYLTGVKSGSATITCNQTLNGKTTLVGKCKVTVEKATISPTYVAESLALGTASFGSWVAEPICNIYNRIPDAKYTYSTNSKDFTIKDTKYEETQAGEGYFGFKQTYTATKAGTYTVTVNETYNGVTRKLGTFKVAVHDLSIREDVSIAPGELIVISSLLSYSKKGINYYYEGDGFDVYKKSADSIAYIAEDKYEGLSIYGVKEGTAKINIYEGKNETSKVLVGSFTVQVSTEYITFKETNYTTYVGDPYCYIFVRSLAGTELDNITLTSSDEDVASVGQGGPFDELIRWGITPLEEGTTTIHAEYGDKSASCTVKVYATWEEYVDATYVNH